TSGLWTSPVPAFANTSWQAVPRLLVTRHASLVTSVVRAAKPASRFPTGRERSLGGCGSRADVAWTGRGRTFSHRCVFLRPRFLALLELRDRVRLAQDIRHEPDNSDQHKEFFHMLTIRMQQHSRPLLASDARPRLPL